MPAVRSNSSHSASTGSNAPPHEPATGKRSPDSERALVRWPLDETSGAATAAHPGRPHGRPRAHMSWSPYRYSSRIVAGRGLTLKGWPNDPDHPEGTVPFGDPSDIPGGQPVISRLLELWKSGELHFEDATPVQRQLAIRDPMAVLPGEPLKLPNHRSATSYGRNDMGKARAQPNVVDEDGEPVERRHKRLGAMSSKLVLDEVDAEDDVISDFEDDVGSSSVVADSDPIESFDDDEA
ncbi:hypothetical protein NUW54_g7658 [Trametes sanguinea]|uniref:Uncharacterized protein n=1 Tax=Trametes sanguinea TaxID=158606 RepID=A0ACC1PM62_9APHY|nr:hypothetical protein NUW54_g7658 [Trametes sanguinea]